MFWRKVTALAGSPVTDPPRGIGLRKVLAPARAGFGSSRIPASFSYNCYKIEGSIFLHIVQFHYNNAGS